MNCGTVIHSGSTATYRVRIAALFLWGLHICYVVNLITVKHIHFLLFKLTLLDRLSIRYSIWPAGNLIEYTVVLAPLVQHFHWLVSLHGVLNSGSRVLPVWLHHDDQGFVGKTSSDSE